MPSEDFYTVIIMNAVGARRDKGEQGRAVLQSLCSEAGGHRPLFSAETKREAEGESVPEGRGRWPVCSHHGCWHEELESGQLEAGTHVIGLRRHVLLPLTGSQSEAGAKMRGVGGKWPSLDHGEPTVAKAVACLLGHVYRGCGSELYSIDGLVYSACQRNSTACW